MHSTRAVFGAKDVRLVRWPRAAGDKVRIAVAEADSDVVAGLAGEVDRFAVCR